MKSRNVVKDYLCFSVANKRISVGWTFPRLMSNKACAFMDNVNMKCLSVHLGSFSFIFFHFVLLKRFLSLILFMNNTLNSSWYCLKMVGHAQCLIIIYITVSAVNKPNLHFFSTGINRILSNIVGARLKLSA